MVRMESLRPKTKPAPKPHISVQMCIPAQFADVCTISKGQASILQYNPHPGEQKQRRPPLHGPKTRREHAPHPPLGAA